jgi:hypothetical protein
MLIGWLKNHIKGSAHFGKEKEKNLFAGSRIQLGSWREREGKRIKTHHRI